VVENEVGTLHVELDAWQKPSDCDVYVVAGTSVETVASIRALTRNRVKDNTTTAGYGVVAVWSALECEATQHYTVNLRKLKAQHLSMLAESGCRGRSSGSFAWARAFMASTSPAFPHPGPPSSSVFALIWWSVNNHRWSVGLALGACLCLV